MKIPASAAPYSLGAPSMVYGEDLIENAESLSCRVNHIELVLFDTFRENNLPTSREIDRLREIGQRAQLGFSIHLPAQLEPAAEEAGLREASMETIIKIIQICAPLKPVHYVLHLPFTKPTLVPVPGLYFPWKPAPAWDQWLRRSFSAMGAIREFLAGESSLLIENINYSPRFLEPFFLTGSAKLCLDIGHLLLGKEDILEHLDYFLDQTAEIHLHGVAGQEDHLSLARLPFDQVFPVIAFLQERAFSGPVILEVFNPQDFEESLALVHQAASLAKNV